MANKFITIEVLRYIPEVDDQPTFKSYEIPYHEDEVILDALNYIKSNLDSSLSFRWSCHMAVCGSCGMVINGKPKLGCKNFIKDYYPGPIRIEPLYNFPVIRDLVVNIDNFVENLAKTKTYTIPKEEKSIDEGVNKQTPAELNKFKQYTMCINCLLCYSACPQYGLTPEFKGPAALALAHRYNADSRDIGQKQRKEQISNSADGIWNCSFVGACSEVCPKDVDPAAAIQQIKISSTLDWYKELLLPKSK